MANSLRAKISKLRHDGKISDAEYQEIIKKLDGHDAKIREELIDEIVEEMDLLNHQGGGLDDLLFYLINLKEQK